MSEQELLAGSKLVGEHGVGEAAARTAGDEPTAAQRPSALSRAARDDGAGDADEKDSDEKDSGEKKVQHRRTAALPHAIYGDIIQIIDFASIAAISFLVAYIYHIEVLIIDFDYELYTSAGIIGATALTAILRRDGFYDFDQLLVATKAIRAIVTRWVLIILGLIAFAFTLKISDLFSRFWLFTWMIVSGAALAGVRIAAAAFLRRAAAEGGVFGRRVAVVGAADACATFCDQVERVGRGLSVVGVFRLDEDDLSPGAVKSCGEMEAVERLARAGDVDDILIAARNIDRAEMAEMVERLSSLPVSVALLSSVHWMDHLGGEVVRIGGAPALRLYRRPLEGWGGFVKTVEDRVLGAVLLLLATPLLAACALALKLQGPGPVLFAQQRHGFNHEVFRIYKFRTMTVAEDGASVTQAKKGDARITKVGAFLRKWSLDELPQLFNVLRGEMSLIGPRPHALAHNHAYAKMIENYSGRHRVKPGITGWAQVNGYRGETSEKEQMANRVRYDLEYIDNWSLWFDLKILVLTVFAVLFPKNAH
ncbi:MAG: undecaprenyl-phosphate glucose phosphotransferase [Pseudomonadota bacterium]